MESAVGVVEARIWRVCVISELQPKGWLRPVRAMALKLKEKWKGAWS